MSGALNISKLGVWGFLSDSFAATRAQGILTWCVDTEAINSSCKKKLDTKHYYTTAECDNLLIPLDNLKVKYVIIFEI